MDSTIAVEQFRRLEAQNCRVGLFFGDPQLKGDVPDGRSLEPSGRLHTHQADKPALVYLAQSLDFGVADPINV
jgi:hypothetical protein